VSARGGVFAFTTRLPGVMMVGQQPYGRQVVGKFEIFVHAPATIDALLGLHGFTRRRLQRSFVGDDLFLLWVVGR
jgi:hypothetical protein